MRGCTCNRESQMTVICHLSESKAYTYTPRLFELTSATGEFTANEVLFTARSNEVEAFPFQQSDIYSAIQPGEWNMHKLVRSLSLYQLVLLFSHVSIGRPL